MCPNRQPLLVEIFKSELGLPDPNGRIVSFAFEEDPDPLTYSYLSVEPGIDLEAGTYFALFRAQGDDTGHILSSQVGGYLADATILGFLRDGERLVSSSPLRAGVLIPGTTPVPEPATLTLLSGGLLAAALYRRRQRARVT